MMSPIFQLFLSPGHLMVRRRPGEGYKPQCLTPPVKFDKVTLMIWGLFTRVGIRQIFVCKGDMNYPGYPGN